MPAPASKTKDGIRDAARVLFANRGYEGVSMRDIAEAVGIRQSGIYNHFNGKQAILVDLMVGHMDGVLERLGVAMEGKVGAQARLEAFARFHVRDHIDRPEDVFLAYMELRSLEDAGRAQVLALRDAYEGALREILNGAVSDPAVTARMLLAMMTGVTVWYRDGGALSREDVVETYVRGVMGAVDAG